MGNVLSDISSTDRVELLNTLRIQKNMITYLQKRIDILHDEYNDDISNKTVQLHAHKTISDTLEKNVEIYKEDLRKSRESNLHMTDIVSHIIELARRQESDIVSNIFQEQQGDYHTDIVQRIKYYRHGASYFQSRLKTILENNEL